MSTEIEIEVKDDHFAEMAELLAQITDFKSVFTTQQKVIFSVLIQVNKKVAATALTKKYKPSKKGKFKYKLKFYEAFYLENTMRLALLELDGYTKSAVQVIADSINQKIA